MSLIPIIFATTLLGQSSVEIKELKAGMGTPAKSGDVITVSYRGTLSSGKLFDESKGKAPYSFRIGAGQVIKGWDQGLIGIKKGGKRRLVVPPDLAYGSSANGPIPANSTLIFEIEALRIESPNTVSKVEIRELRKGNGNLVKGTSTVKVHYTGTFLNGVSFDSSIGSDPLTVAMGQGMVIPGFEEGLLGMREKGRRRVTIPFRLGYGERGRPPRIPAYCTLVFEFEVISVKG